MDIVDNLPTKDLLSISSVSKNLHASVEPLLYRTISWDWDIVPVRRILRLLWTTLEQPRLAAHIQHVARLTSPEIKVDHGPWKPLPCDELE